MSKIHINLGQNSYNIFVGSHICNKINEFLIGKNYSKIIIITDQNLAKFHLDNFEKEIAKSNLPIKKIIIESGEKSKSFVNLEKITEEALNFPIDRKSLIIAFGGGVVGDISGFAASILLRSIDFIQVPTTLLAMTDSSVGGKTAINSNHGKNLIGSFYQPKLVICDLKFLKTLPDRDFFSGYAEVMKYGLIIDIEFFQFLEDNLEKIKEKDSKILEKIITKSCEIKATIVAKDEREYGLRRILNFGHTFGHIFETESNYSGEILHGEAVAIGMILACKMSENLGFLTKEDVKRVEDHLKNANLPISAFYFREKWDEESLIAHLYKDKKIKNNSLTFILLKKIGESLIKEGIEIKKLKL
ncbi:MAG: 3-dehydroquinate synthase [Rickettsiales bacterium]|jgi:3-dehydroquinate synthase